MAKSGRQTLRSNLARNVRARRQHLEITQEKLSEISDLHQTYVSDVERSRRNVTLDIVERLAMALKLRPYELLLDEGLALAQQVVGSADLPARRPRLTAGSATIHEDPPAYKSRKRKPRRKPRG